MNIPFQRDKKRRKKWTGDKVNCNRGKPMWKKWRRKGHKHNGNSRKCIMKAWHNDVRDEQMSRGWGFPSLVGLIHLFRMPMKAHSVSTQSLWACDVPYCIGCAKLTNVHSHVPSHYRNCIHFLLSQCTILNIKRTRLCFAFGSSRFPIPAQSPYTLSVQCSFPQPL